tara:strand:- start:3166 stop:3402 length:237 start_codon:yes stop_codon:yes gene_type:complete
MSQVTIRALSQVKPSQIGHYNFYYPCTREFTSVEEIEGSRLPWTGGGEYVAVHVEHKIAKIFESPVNVIWVKKESIQD